MVYDIKQVEAYIRRAAAARGMDPDIAVRVAKSEGLAPGAWQSNFVKNGKREPSYGPFQLFMGGGLGNEFKRKTGLDPSDPSTVYQGVDFALDAAKAGGWTPWYGAAKVGVGKWDGIKGGKYVPGQGALQQPGPVQAPGSPAPPLPPPVTIRDRPIGQPSPVGIAAAPTPAPASQQGISPMMQQAFGAMAMQAQPPEMPAPPPIQGPSREQATALTEFVKLLRNRARA